MARNRYLSTETVQTLRDLRAAGWRWIPHRRRWVKCDEAGQPVAPAVEATHADAAMVKERELRGLG